MLKIDLLLCNPPDRSRESCANPTNAVSFQCVPCEWNSTLARRVWNFECHTFECVNRSEDFETTKTAVRFWLKIEEMRNLWKQPWKSKTTHQSLKFNINWALKFRRSLSSLKKNSICVFATKSIHEFEPKWSRRRWEKASSNRNRKKSTRIFVFTRHNWIDAERLQFRLWSSALNL